MASTNRRPGAPPTKRLIKQLETRRKKGVPIKEACREVGLSTATFYQWKRRAEAGENGNVAEFYERVVLHRKQGRLVVAADATPDWRRIDYFQEWVAGKRDSPALILDSGEVWKPEQWQLDPIADVLADLYQAIWLVVPEGNGKTTLTAGVVLYLLEHQLTPEIPIGSATTTQAETLFRQIEGFIIRSGKIQEFNLAPGVRRIDCRKTAGHTRVYPHNERSGDGVIPSASVLDEGHLHPDLRLYRTWKGKYRKRRGPVIGISTAGEPGSEFEDLRSKILKEGRVTRNEGPYLRIVHQSTVLHDWAVRNRDQASNMKVVAAANPLKSINAVEMGQKRAEPEMTEEHWLRRTCNIPSRVEGEGIDSEDWDALEESDLVPDRQAWSIGWIDLGWKIDSTALGILIWEGPTRRVVTEVKVLEPPVDEGDVVKAIVARQREFEPVGWVYDPNAGGQQMAQLLEKGEHPHQGDVELSFIEHSQDNAPMSLAATRLDEAIRNGWIVHGGDAVLRRHALNAVRKSIGSEKWRYDRPPSAKGDKRRQYPNDALIGLAMGHSVAVAENEAIDPNAYRIEQI